MGPWLPAVLVGTLTGILSGFGIGGGSLLLLYLTAVLGMEQHLAQGINLLYFLPAAAAALPGHWKNGYIDGRTAHPAVLAGLVGTAAGAWAALAVDPGLLRRLFGAYLTLVGLRQLFTGKKSR